MRVLMLFIILWITLCTALPASLNCFDLYPVLTSTPPPSANRLVNAIKHATSQLKLQHDFVNTIGESRMSRAWAVRLNKPQVHKFQPEFIPSQRAVPDSCDAAANSTLTLAQSHELKDVFFSWRNALVAWFTALTQNKLDINDRQDWYWHELDDAPIKIEWVVNRACSCLSKRLNHSDLVMIQPLLMSLGEQYTYMRKTFEECDSPEACRI